MKVASPVLNGGDEETCPQDNAPCPYPTHQVQSRSARERYAAPFCHRSIPYAAVFTRSVSGHHGIKMVYWTSNTMVHKHCLFPVSFMCSRAAFDWVSREMAAEFLEKSQKIAMEKKRWDQPDTREKIR